MDHFDLPRDAVVTAMYYVDQIVLQQQHDYCGDGDSAGPAAAAACSSCNIRNRRDFQLLAVGAVYLSTKILRQRADATSLESPSSDRVVLTPENMSTLTKKLFTECQIADTELRILRCMDWRLLHPPTPSNFTELLVRLLVHRIREGPEDVAAVAGDIRDVSVFMVEHATLDSFFVKYRPSEIAAAAVSNAVAATMALHCSSTDNDGMGKPMPLSWASPTKAIQDEFMGRIDDGFVDPRRVSECRHRLYDLMEHSQAPARHVLERMNSPISVVAGATTQTSAGGIGCCAGGRATYTVAGDAESNESVSSLTAVVGTDKSHTGTGASSDASGETLSDPAIV